MVSRYDYALRVLNGLGLPLNASDEEVEKAVFDAYPFGPRKYHPYDMWLKAVRQWKADRARLLSWNGGAR